MQRALCLPRPTTAAGRLLADVVDDLGGQTLTLVSVPEPSGRRLHLPRWARRCGWACDPTVSHGGGDTTG